jgi:hypothetical protein
MTEDQKFTELLKGAAKAAQRRALRKGIPYAISVNGKIEVVQPLKKRAKAVRKKTKSARKRVKSKAK